MPVTVIGNLTHHLGLATKAVITAITTAKHGQLYFPNDALEAYMGMYDGTVVRIGGVSAWSSQTDDSTVIAVGNGATLNILGENKIKTRAVSGDIKIGIDTTGATSGYVLTSAGSGVAPTWSAIPTGYITSIGDTATLDLNVVGTTLSGTVLLDPAGDNDITKVSGLYSKKYTIHPSDGSANYLSINGSNQISVSQLLVTDVTVDSTGKTSLALFLSGGLGTGIGEGDVVILPGATGGTETWIHNGGTAGTTADYNRINTDSITDAYIRTLFTAQTPLAVDGVGKFSLGGLSTMGTSGQIVTSTGTGWAYINNTFVSQAYTTVKNSAGTAQTQRSILKFSSDFSPADTGGETVVSLGTKLANLSALAGNGIIVQTAANTFANRTITGTTDRVTIVNGDGISGNPTIDIASTYVGQTSITTLGTIGTGTWNATNISLAKGGTGASLTAPGSDSIFFYDVSASSTAFLSLGTGLAIVGTELQLSAGSDTNPWYTLNTSTKADGATGTIYHNGLQIIGNAATGYTTLSSKVSLEVNGGIASLGANSRIVLKATDSSSLFQVTVNSDGILNVVAFVP